MSKTGGEGIIKKIFYIFLTAFLLFTPSCEKKIIPTGLETDAAENENEDDIMAEPETFPAAEYQAGEAWEPAEIETDGSHEPKELIYDALYTVEEIADFFSRDKELFERVRDIKIPAGCDYFTADRYETESYGGEFKIISEFFDRCGYIYFIHSIDPESKDYLDENIIALFRVRMNLPGIDAGYIPWGEIRYNRNGGEIKEESNTGYMIIPLDGHWYYIYGNIYLIR